jgi:thiol-disulfide isomerase/thioredoxin|uniref:Thioredoxin domain-containing protein n=1 Tax=viral metagenome TaxID=1070528 RepID=A0A6C0B0G9_9ZZZZ
MSETVWIILVVCLTFFVVIAAYRFFVGYYPGSKFIVEDPPVQHNGLDSDQARFMFFYTTWCPWSHKAWKPWKAFKQMMKNKQVKYGGKTVLFEEINAEADKGKAALYNVKEYPTFKLETADKVYLLQAVPDPATFDIFLVGTLGKKTLS